MAQNFIVPLYGELGEGGVNNDYLIPGYGLFTETSVIAYSLSITTGAYSIGGVSAAFHVTKTFQPSTGAYVVAGQTTALHRSYEFAPTTGAYLIDGQPANLIAAKVLSAVTGAYAISGKDAILSKGLGLFASTGVYSVVGYDAQFSIAANFHSTFSEFSNLGFVDWGDADYQSFLAISQTDEGVDTKENSPYIYTFLKQTADSDEDSEGATITGYWDWANDASSKRVTEPQEIYQFRDGFLVCARRHKMRGRGRQLQLRFDSETGKNFNLLGWAVFYVHNAQQ